jgi:pre-mRNA-splicing factor RBM22/SLT11
MSGSRLGWEEAEFPILCNDCLGNSPYLRMAKLGVLKECKTCSKPFTVFRWSPGPNLRYRRTHVCQSCAKIRNVCQTCVLDLQYSLPAAERDAVLGINDLPKDQINRMYQVQKLEQNVTDPTTRFGKADAVTKAFLKKMARAEPYQRHNAPNFCPMYIKGNCIKDRDCPYRHDLPSHLRAIKMKNEAAALEPLKISALFIAGFDPSTTDKDLKSHFERFGKLKSITLLPKGAAFIHYRKSDDAQEALDALGSIIDFRGKSCRLELAKLATSSPSVDVSSYSSMNASLVQDLDE